MGDTIKYHKYYQWVCFVLFFQALLFYIPRYLWKTWEAGKMKMLVLDLGCPIIAEDTKNERKKLLVDYFASNLHNHNFYALRFFICELLNFVNVIGQIYFVDYFLGGEFTTYGRDVIAMTELEPEERVDPMAKVFPKVTKCTFYKFGPSGTTQRIDGLCVLPLNIVNEKIYVFLWFWLIILAVISGLSLVYRLAVILGTQVRFYLCAPRPVWRRATRSNWCRASARSATGSSSSSSAITSILSSTKSSSAIWRADSKAKNPFNPTTNLLLKQHNNNNKKHNKSKRPI